jgi:hypothetical protein
VKSRPADWQRALGNLVTVSIFCCPVANQLAGIVITQGDNRSLFVALRAEDDKESLADYAEGDSSTSLSGALSEREPWA